MAKKKFDAILAKNNIAREIRAFNKWKIKYIDYTEAGACPLNSSYIVECLKDIEDYLGESNQPCVIDIIEDKTGSI